MEVQIVAFDGFDELDVFGLYEPLKMAAFETRLFPANAHDKLTGFD